MGRPDSVMQYYLSDKGRFADLFNGIFFQGEQFIQSCDLQDSSERYSEKAGQGTSRFRDIKMTLKNSRILRILAVENQANIDYTMPYRCMQYDVMEYGKQLRERKNTNRAGNLLTTSPERLCGITKTDRIAPVYTLCLYHGEEPWDGPLSLRDMMDFGNGSDRMEQYFADYPLRLYCVNGMNSFDVFHTELRELFSAMRYRRDKERLQKLFACDARYSHLSSDTVRALSVLLNIPDLWRKREQYRDKTYGSEEYNMCQAWEEIKEECYAKGVSQGISQGITQGISQGISQGIEKGSRDKARTIVQNMLKHGFSKEEICELTECSAEFVSKLQ